MSEMNSFQEAFYIIAKELGFDYAQPLSPREVFEQQILPRIRELVATQPAAHGDEVVLWEMLEELRTATDRQALPGEFIRVMWEAGCDWINARAAMRAQGDGEVQ